MLKVTNSVLLVRGGTKGNQNEIDIVAIYLDNKSAIVAEVKRQKKEFQARTFPKESGTLRE